MNEEAIVGGITLTTTQMSKSRNPERLLSTKPSMIGKNYRAEDRIRLVPYSLRTVIGPY